MHKSSSFESSSNSRLYVALLTLIVGSYCAWVLSLPLFPTQDGPVHLYFVHVLRELLTGHGSFYQQYYYIRHILPPYSLYYYTLLLLSSFLPILVADKVVICLYFISFAFGFRYLAKAVGRDGELMALPASLLLLNWPLGMGFVNFCLSTSLGFWALGLWCRALGRDDTKRKVGFVVMAYVIMLTHPVPLLAVLGFCGVELCIRLVRFRRSRPKPGSDFVPAGWSRDLVYVIAAAGTLAYVKLFTAAHVLQPNEGSTGTYWSRQLSNLKAFVLLHSLSPFTGRTVADAVYRFSLYALLLVAMGLAIRNLRQAMRRGSWSVADTWTLVSLGFTLGFPFITPDLNNSAYFAARLVFYIWICALVAASGARIERAVVRGVIAGGSVALTALILIMAHQRIGPIARDTAQIEQMAGIKAHSVGLFLDDPNYEVSPVISYDPYFWNGARMFRRTDSVMYNTPWLNLPIIPLGPRPLLPSDRLGSVPLEGPKILRRELTGSPEDREFVLSHVDTAIVSGGINTASKGPDVLLREDPVGSHQWRCTMEGRYSVCGVR